MPKPRANISRATFIDLYQKGTSIPDIAAYFKIGKTTARKYRKDYGLPARTLVDIRRVKTWVSNPLGQPSWKTDHKGSNNPVWRGGFTLRSNGGVRIYLGDKKYMERARWVMEQHLDRKLLSTEKVIHVDGDKNNDRLSNLKLIPHGESQWTPERRRKHSEHMKQLYRDGRIRRGKKAEDLYRRNPPLS